jgi:hypothetical protein
LKALTLVADIERLRDLWPWVEKGLYVVKRRGKARWLPADVYMDIRANKCALWTCGQDDGFMVTKTLDDCDGQVLFVWCIYGRLAHIEQDIIDDLDELARTIKAKRIQMRSPRKWASRGYFHEQEVVFEREASYGR